MRVIESPWRETALQLGHLTPEHQEKLLGAIENGSDLRVSVAADSHGQEIRRLSVTEYISPLGITRRAVRLIDSEGTETVDFDDDTEAEAYYEGEVRSFTETTGESPTWDESDVEGIPLTLYTWILYARVPGGDWERTGSGSSQLGARLDDNIGTEPSTLEQAAEAILTDAAATQIGHNRDSAICEAADDLTTVRVFDAIQTEVTGDAGQGDTTIALTEDVPLHTVTPEEITRYRQILNEIARHEEETNDHYAY
jgi:hypothetical protein